MVPAALIKWRQGVFGKYITSHDKSIVFGVFTLVGTHSHISAQVNDSATTATKL